MYVHLGGDVVVPIQDIVGIFDARMLDGSRDNERFLASARASGRMLVEMRAEDTKSVVVTTHGVYASAISSLTLVRRVTNVQWGLGAAEG
ncbi:MAG TPA: extracellular matrix/biofilm biosynthesis regulator RemA family protein [bacterium]|nr:extracellular matrix/biofilm biosynthesis regulator RemA family protein [bacterium]